LTLLTDRIFADERGVHWAMVK